MLPIGSAKWNHTVVICIGVTDSIGSTSYKFERAVTVRVPVLELANISAMVSAKGGSFSEFIRNGDAASLSSLAIAMMGTMNSLSTEIPKEDTDTEQLSEPDSSTSEHNEGNTLFIFYVRHSRITSVKFLVTFRVTFFE